MPTIRLDDDVFNGLKSLAEPFTDTPNTVIRRLLKERGILLEQAAEPSRPARLPSASPPGSERPNPRLKDGTLVPQPIYERFLLHILANRFKGRGDKGEITRAVIHEMTSRGILGDAEHVHVSTGETRAANTIAWGRNALKERGLISQASPRGTWELTERGLKEGLELRI